MSYPESATMVRLERVSLDNWRQVITLDIADNQRRFLKTPSVLYGVAEVQFHPTYTASAIYDDKGYEDGW